MESPLNKIREIMIYQLAKNISMRSSDIAVHLRHDTHSLANISSVPTHSLLHEAPLSLAEEKSVCR